MDQLPDWFDTFHGAYCRNMNRILEGRRFTAGADADEFAIVPGYDFTVARVSGAVVGIDSYGIFAGITVLDTFGEGREWTFYADGRVVDADDVTVGRHTLALGPDPAAIVGRGVSELGLAAQAAGVRP